MFHGHIEMCAIKILPVFPAHGILLFLVCTSGCLVCVVPTK